MKINLGKFTSKTHHLFGLLKFISINLLLCWSQFNRRQSWACARDEGATGQGISRPPPDTRAPGRRRPEGAAAADAAKGRRRPNPSPDLEE